MAEDSGSEKYVHWVYQIYNALCANHPRLSYCVMLVILIVVFTIGYRFVSVRAPKWAVEVEAKKSLENQPAGSVNSSTSGDYSPNITGNGNTVIYNNHPAEKSPHGKAK